MGKHSVQSSSKSKTISAMRFVAAWLLYALSALSAFICFVSLLGIGEKGAFGALVICGVISWASFRLARLARGKKKTPGLRTKDPNAKIDVDNAEQRARAASGRWDGIANPGESRVGSSRQSLPLVSVETVVGGTYPTQVYVYDGAPLKTIRNGAEFYADVVTRDVTVRSVLTGGVWSGEPTDSAFAVEYDGRPFGVIFNGIAARHIRTLREYGHGNLKIRMVRDGWYKRPIIPEVTAYTPTLGEAMEYEQEEKARAEARELERLGITDFHIDETIHMSSGWRGGTPSMGEKAVYTVMVRSIPTPPGSTAKPHMTLVSDDGTVLSESTARSSCYEKLAPLEGKRLKIVVTQPYYGTYQIDAQII